ncbi:MAG: hypothetical protein A4E58_02967 [Syntrophorhabdus sp. PtaB.Bin006]|nr:MAG: hypothetical protein A4E58_02967 [Syntrophorhabdus sp. PtaB.Bin006]
MTGQAGSLASERNGRRNAISVQVLALRRLTGSNPRWADQIRIGIRF